jgi:hypothetical protein
MSPVGVELFSQRNINVCAVIVAVVFCLMVMGAVQIGGITIGLNVHMQSTQLQGKQAEAGKEGKRPD